MQLHPQQRVALFSLVAATFLVALKAITGLITGSLALLSDAAHSVGDMIAASVTFVVTGIATQPPDSEHQYGHGKAQHLGGMVEATFLIMLSVFITREAWQRFADPETHTVEAHWWVFVVIAIVLVVDWLRARATWRASREHDSAALRANAAHFASDFAGTMAVLFGMVAIALGYGQADLWAALGVAAVVGIGGIVLLRENIDALMDRVPHDIRERIRAAILDETDVELRRLRVRESGGHYFADIVIGVAGREVVGQGHTRAHDVENVVRDAVDRLDVVVHVEPLEVDPTLEDRVLAAVLSVPDVREVHNLQRLTLREASNVVSLHFRLGHDIPMIEVAAIMARIEHAVSLVCPELDELWLHPEPLAVSGEAIDEPAARPGEGPNETMIRDAAEAAGIETLTDVRILQGQDLFVVHVGLGVEPESSLASAHEAATDLERVIHALDERISVVTVRLDALDEA